MHSVFTVFGTKVLIVVILRVFFFAICKISSRKKEKIRKTLFHCRNWCHLLERSFSFRNKSLGQDVFVIDWQRLPCFTDLSVLFHLSITDLDNCPIKRDFERQLKNAQINTKQEKTAFHNLKNYCSRGIQKDLPIQKIA